MSNEDKRLAIVAELGRRAEQSGAEAKFYQRLTPAMAIMLQEAGVDAVQLMGLVRALAHYTAMVAYGTINTPGDVHFRTGEDFAKLAEGMWEEACKGAERLVAELKAKGVDVPEELARKVKAAPSDPSKRPDTPPKEPTLPTERPDNLQDIIARINTPGSRGN